MDREVSIIPRILEILDHEVPIISESWKYKPCVILALHVIGELRQPMPTPYADDLCRQPMPTTYADNLCRQAVPTGCHRDPIGTMKRSSLLYKWSKNALQRVCRQPMPTHLCRQPMPTTYADTLCRHPMPTTYADNLCRQACQSRAKRYQHGTFVSSCGIACRQRLSA